MAYLFVKLVVTAAIIVAISEAAKRLPLFAALLASLPLTSLLAICWLYWDTGDVAKVSQLSHEILVILPPSFVFFIMLPLLLKRGTPFIGAVTLACVCTGVAYAVYMKTVRTLGWL